MPVNDNSKIVRFRRPNQARLVGRRDPSPRRKPDGGIWFDHTQAQPMEVNWVLDQVKLNILDRD